MQKVCIEKVRNERDRWLSSEEEGRLLAHSAPWLQDIIVFALNTGMRRGERLQLAVASHQSRRRWSCEARTERSGLSAQRSVNEVVAKKKHQKGRQVPAFYEFS